MEVWHSDPSFPSVPFQCIYQYGYHWWRSQRPSATPFTVRCRQRKSTNISPPRSAQSSRPCATPSVPFEPLLNVFAARSARWAAKSPRADPGHAEHSYSPSRDRGAPRPWPMKGRRDQGRWHAFVGRHAGRTHDQLRGTGRHHQDRRRKPRRRRQR